MSYLIDLTRAGLTAAEIETIQAIARKELEETVEGSVDSLIDSYVRGYRIDPDAVQVVAMKICSERVSYKTPSWFEREVKVDESGFGMSHPSYLAVRSGRPSGASQYAVGAASLSSYGRTMAIRGGRLTGREHGDPFLMETDRDFELYFTFEQWNVMIQSVNGDPVPCGRLRNADGLMQDAPPVLFKVSDDKIVRNAIFKLMTPFTDHIDKAIKLLEQPVSKKADYAAIADVLNLALQTMEDSKEKLMGLISDFTLNERERAINQFQSEVNKRLATVGLEDMSDTLRLTQSDK